jgi:putative tryptophan/tyrosine transport system substrate-binding protein
MDRRGSRLSRRDFVAGGGVAGLGMLAGCGRLSWQGEPPPKLPRVGVLLPYTQDSAASLEMLQPFWAGLQDWGYAEGQNVLLEYRYSGGQNDRLPALATELVQLPVDVIVAEKHDAIMAAKQATATIPIVLTLHVDPVGLGLVASLARPGGNLTGMSATPAWLTGKRLELLPLLSPTVSRIAIFYDSTYSPAQRAGAEAKLGAEALGLKLLAFDVRTPADFAPAFEAALRERAGGLLVALTDPLTLSQRRRIVDFAAQNGLPAVYPEKSWCTAGGLMTYGANFAAISRRTAYYVDRILKGTKPADLPIEQPMTFDFVVNLKTAQALGITFPNEIMLQVTEVIQ